MLICITLLSILDIIGAILIIYTAYNMWINRKGKRQMERIRKTFYELFDLGLQNNIYIKEALVVDNKMCLQYSFHKDETNDREICLDSTLTNEEIINKLKETKKPPLGIKPHFIWIEQRIDEIIKAMDRYRESNKDIPQDWYIELAWLEKCREPAIEIFREFMKKSL